jgi:oligoribonuclease (3'-5' exoribonuclease)
VLHGKARQWAKIGQIREALLEAGYLTLDAQAEALGLNRSTAWSILVGKHKNSGLSTSVILTMLSRSECPSTVREKLQEYVEEKAAGLYGDKPFRVRQFMKRLSPMRINSPGHEFEVAITQPAQQPDED